MEEATQPEVREQSLKDELAELNALVHELMAMHQSVCRENAQLRLRIAELTGAQDA